jgi:glutamine amidotransferase
MDVALVDSGGANIGSLIFALKRLGADAELTADANRIRRATRVILPGVGAAASAMQKLRGSGLDRLIPQLTQPVLGICLGMQLLFEGSQEGGQDCLGIIPGRARKLDAGPGIRTPHMGWNQIEPVVDSTLLTGIANGEYAYFVHGYAVPVTDNAIAVTRHGQPFASVASRDNFYATQFHPERSAQVGQKLLKNFMAIQ